MNDFRPILPRAVAASVPGVVPATTEAAASGGGAPIGHDAPRHSAEWANYTAACIAAQAVRGRAIHSEAHRQSLEAWERGERSWPWPDPTPEEQAAADIALRSLIAPLLTDAELTAHSADQRKFNREHRA